MDPAAVAQLRLRLDAVASLDAAALEAEEIALLGRKQGQLTLALKAVAELPVEERRAAGQALNALKAEFEAAFTRRKGELLAASRSAETSGRDLTMPGRAQWPGTLHPVTLVVNEIVEIFRELGFAVALGPDAESEESNFFALNFAHDHPALDLHDTLYLESREPGTGNREPGTGNREPGTGNRELSAEGRMLLRTHTSPVQIRVMRAGPPPYRVVIPGMAYRSDPFDASHAPAFLQIEGLAVDEGIAFCDLKATLTHFARRFFRDDRPVRFRPSFFPFTEPSAEMDIACAICQGAGCSACKGTGWMEILGCGMVHEQVLRNCGVDPERYTGWAFGMGPARIAMLRYGIPDIRLLYGGDMRFLTQFGGVGR